ncbi:uncharacterized protein LOC117653712 [Thrips palmi]|uniref:Uncharacterized protein LOC117653712 n=1 Tax=Thrips palmi TaxID=161013 RepID=A0A6P9AJ23_THRPL|nr:uncharacterized protein LOC117653712 [Thrips palmi]
MSRKGKYFLLMHSKDPDAADLIRSDSLVADGGIILKPGDEAVYVLETTKGRLEEVRGVVVATGLKKDLIRLHVTADGSLTPLKGVGTRKQELERKRMEQVNAQKIQLQQTAQQLQAEGADVVCEQLQPVIKEKSKRPPCLPKKRSPEVMEQIQRQLDALPCFKNGPLKRELYVGTKIFVDQGKFNLNKQKYALRPACFHRALLKLAVPENILRLDGVSCHSKRGCIGLNRKIQEAIVLAVNTQYQKAGGSIHNIRYDPDEILRNLIDATVASKGKRFLLPPSSSESTPASTSEPIPTPFTFQPPASTSEPIPTPFTFQPPASTSEPIPTPFTFQPPASTSEPIPTPFTFQPPASTSEPIPTPFTFQPPASTSQSIPVPSTSQSFPSTSQPITSPSPPQPFPVSSLPSASQSPPILSNPSTFCSLIFSPHSRLPICHPPTPDHHYIDISYNMPPAPTTEEIVPHCKY